jgi:hypothetical protein
MLAIVACGNSSSSWIEGVDMKGAPQIFNAPGNTCLNLLDDSCKAGQEVHAGPCQKDAPKKVRVGNHFSWNENASAIACLACKGKDLCVNYSAAGGIGLAPCSKATGWSRETADSLGSSTMRAKVGRAASHG